MDIYRPKDIYVPFDVLFIITAIDCCSHNIPPPKACRDKTTVSYF